MSIPEHIWRFLTRRAIDSLAARFNFPNTPEMQDWEWEVADPKRIPEFVSVYESGELDDDEKFTLMETIIQSFADLEIPLSDNEYWKHVLEIIEKNIDLHIYSVWYWSDLETETENEDEQWHVTPDLRSILFKYKGNYAQQLR